MTINASLEEKFYLVEMFTKEISKMMSVTGRACTNGQTAKSTMEIIKMVRRTDMASKSLQTVMSTTVSGKMT